MKPFLCVTESKTRVREVLPAAGLEIDNTSYQGGFMFFGRVHRKSIEMIVGSFPERGKKMNGKNRLYMFVLWSLLMLTGTQTFAAHVLVDLAKVNSRIVINMKYATADNFLKQKLYTGNKCYLLDILAQKLDRAQKILEKDGLGLMVLDGYRPESVQKKMWEILPDERFIANPYKNGSHHCRGAAVDLTRGDSQGRELDMPTPFDNFTGRAYQFSLEPSPQQRANRMLLRKVMLEVGLEYIKTEWWHYQLPGARRYPIIKESPQMAR